MMYDQTVDEAVVVSEQLPQPAVQIIKGHRKTSSRQEKGKHIDTVYPQQIADEIEQIVKDENIATTSILMRQLVAFSLMIRRRAKRSYLLVLYSDEGEAVLKMPTESVFQQ